MISFAHSPFACRRAACTRIIIAHQPRAKCVCVFIISCLLIVHHTNIPSAEQRGVNKPRACVRVCVWRNKLALGPAGLTGFSVWGNGAPPPHKRRVLLCCCRSHVRIKHETHICGGREHKTPNILTENTNEGTHTVDARSVQTRKLSFI